VWPATSTPGRSRGNIPHKVWLAAGGQGFLGLNVPEEYGGGGTEDYRLRVAMIEEMARVPAVSLAAGFATQTDIVLPYLFDFATPEQCKRWLPKMTTGEYIGAIAMTEPGTGSDLQGITTTATRDGGAWVLNGAKTFITNGINADLVVVVAAPPVGGRREAAPSASSWSRTGCPASPAAATWTSSG
jgi:alkylation response protein AidB-like acyl-CoA dehydrogenase